MSTPVGQKMAAVFLFDCSPSMGQLQSLVYSSVGPSGVVSSQTREVEPISVMKEFTKSKIGQRIIRELKTTPVSLISFGTNKTKNMASAKLKDKLGSDYAKEDDPFRNVYEQLGWEFALSAETVAVVDKVEVNPRESHTSLSDALFVGYDKLSSETKFKNYLAKEIYLLTDGTHETDWDSVDKTATELKAHGISLTVIGFNFDDKQNGYEEIGKSEIKRHNERELRKLVVTVGNGSRCLSAGAALLSLSVPVVKDVNSVSVPMELTLGERPTDMGDPEYDYKQARSISIRVQVKKATMPASVKSMKKMSISGFERIAAREAQFSQSQRAKTAASTSGKKDKSPDAIKLKEATDANLLDKEQLYKLANETISDELFVKSARDIFDERRAKLAAKEYDVDRLLAFYIDSSRLKRDQAQDLAHLGKSLQKLLDEAGLTESRGEEDEDPHTVSAERRYYYKPKPAEEGGGDDDEEHLEVVDGERLTKAYHYGGDIIPLEDMVPGTGELQELGTGLQVNGFMKMKDFRFDYRVGDISYVFAEPSYPESGDLFSALINAMLDKDSLAIVRLVGKGSNRNEVFKYPDPKMCALWPMLDDQGIEFAYMCQLPFAEDIRSFNFPSLTRLVNRKGEVVTNHKTLPTVQQSLAMDGFVDAMDLVEPADDDNEDEPRSFFDVKDSYSPAIHNINNTLLHRLANPEGELPPVHESLKRFMNPPEEVVERALKARERIVREFDVTYVPPRSKTIRKQTINFGGEHDPDEHLQTERLFGTHQGGSPVTTKPAAERKPVPMDVDEDADEPGTDDDEDMGKVKAEKMITIDDDDDDDEPRPLSLTDPLPDFDEQLAAHGASQAIKLAFACAQELVETSFSEAKYPLALKVLFAARKTAELKKAPNFYNVPVGRLVKALNGHPKGKKDFVKKMRDNGAGLIGGDSEALWTA